MLRVFLIFVQTLILSLFALSPSASFSQDDFASGVAAFKSEKLEDAKKIFLKLEAENPGHPTLLLNLGLIAQKQKQPGAALGLWRKGLAFHPTDEALANAVDWLKPKLSKTEIAHDIDAWEEWRRILLLRVSPVTTIVVSALLLFFSGFFFLRWWGRRSRALEEDLALPPPPVGGIVLGGLFCFVFAISIAIFIDRLDVRGTIVVEKAEVRSAPDAAATVLFDVFEGMEVIVQDVRKTTGTAGEETWRRITYPGGNTGWIRDVDVLTPVDSSERAFPTAASPRPTTSSPPTPPAGDGK